MAHCLHWAPLWNRKQKIRKKIEESKRGARGICRFCHMVNPALVMVRSNCRCWHNAILSIQSLFCRWTLPTPNTHHIPDRPLSQLQDQAVVYSVKANSNMFVQHHPTMLNKLADIDLTSFKIFIQHCATLGHRKNLIYSIDPFQVFKNFSIEGSAKLYYRVFQKQNSGNPAHHHRQNYCI